MNNCIICEETSDELNEKGICNYCEDVIDYLSKGISPARRIMMEYYKSRR